MNQVEDRISELQDKVDELEDSDNNEDKQIKKHEQNIQDLWDTTKRPNLCMNHGHRRRRGMY
jgi:TolA-binding protein